LLKHSGSPDALVKHLARDMARPETRDPHLPAHLAVGLVQARLELIKRNLDREAYSGRAQFLDVGLHDVVTPWMSGSWPSGY
jgi:hypothetical protein